MIRTATIIATLSALIALPALAAEREHSAKGLKEVVVTAINAGTTIEYWDGNTVQVEIPDAEWPENLVIEEHGRSLEISTLGKKGSVDVRVDECDGDDCDEVEHGPRAIFLHEGSEDPIVLDLDDIADGDENVWVKKIGDDDDQITIERIGKDGKRVVIKRKVVRVDGSEDVEVEVVPDGDDVKKVIVLKRGDGEFEFEHETDDIVVHKIKGDRGKERRKRVSVRVNARKDGDIPEVKTITLRIPRDLRVVASTVNGSMDVGSGSGDARLTTVNGSLTVSGFEGDVVARTVGGALTVEKAKGEVHAATVSGSINIHDARGDVEARTVSGKIDVHGDVEDDTTCEVRTTSGAVTFHLPKRASFNYDVDTLSGIVNGKSFQIPSNKGRVVGTVGNADTSSATIKVETISGKIQFLDE